MTVPFEKYHGTGNDFVVVDANEFVPNRRALAAVACDRETGVSRPASVESEAVHDTGADGVLFLALEDRYSPPRVVMTLVQPDGSTAAMCGNGARCVAHWASRRTGADTVMIDTQAGTRPAEIDGSDVSIDMGTASFEPEGVPLARERPLVDEQVGGFDVTAVNTGVPHAVAFVDDVNDVDIDAVAPAIRHADVFPEGANVTFASGHPDGGFDQRTYERGVEGETRSCGTGAVAVAVAARRLGLLDDSKSVPVRPPGGTLHVSIGSNGVTTLRGPVEREFEGRTDAPEAFDRRNAPEV